MASLVIDDERLPPDEDLLTTPEPFTPQPLPQLTDQPQLLPDSCLSLSLPLLAAIHACLPPSPALTLSIGSGTGLVEALLESLPNRAYELDLVSVEVAPSPNRYHAKHRTVPGTWALEGMARRARAWVFVYPKRVELVGGYMREMFAGEEGPETVVYVGPRRDWEDFRCCFEGEEVAGIEVWGEERMEGVGGRGWECVAVVKRKER
ncbi:hypothetical protein CPLU01_04353 [Colletotrichum plurivorum]|uniref:Uncharacterized protein n=1 Tax=Colletotrichum plurivorum TaxID=2175906 RepID=A0A8H6KQ11_9PEZI|nr:hypothetical protein CPLU01_04353 [Colletotrichum plurivorum]